ncbi:PLP-dependent cysteine synthase family protein [Hippea sp. KM1]|uniref:PLP-dependent cysteine synthase family protein n=1 Tax=Hippea sp. KM1 TaxID=944481 RepID=UPI00046CC898|nr:cysteine synthase family protein [Hippea sp. KM1]
MNIIDAIGSTPIVRLKSGIYAKLEFFNPTGSIKDRTTWGMLKDALDKKIIDRKKGIIEPTSGNTGISLAFLGAYLGIPTTIVMPENMSRQRIKMMESFGANVILTAAKGGMKESIKKAIELAKEGYTFLDQFSNNANPMIHYNTTAIEIERQIKTDILVCGIGTGGTFTGIAKRLKQSNPNMIAVAVEPSGSPFLSQGKSGIHKIQGLGAGFAPSVLDVNLIDRVVAVSDEDALNYQEKLIKEEGIFAGISSGAVYWAALKIKEEYKDKTVVVIFADSADRYI